MADLSLIIRNAAIVDGTGAPAYRGDLAVRGDRIAAVGRIEGTADQEIDAKGQVLSPGFIDIHTHYDPQLCWDRRASPSPEHGVTSLVAGNCSVSLAPVRPADKGLVIKLFGAVEDMESGQLTATIPFTWETFGEYLDYLKKDLGPNVGVFLGHSNLRFYVMGAAAQQRAATDAELATMCDVLRESLRAGAFGLSFTFMHLDSAGNQLPSFYSDRRERLALMKVMAEERRGVVELTPPFLRPFDELAAFLNELGALALETGVPCSMSPILQVSDRPKDWRRLLLIIDSWRARGAPFNAQTQVRPRENTINLTMGSVTLSKTPAFRRVLELPAADRIPLLKDPEIRRQIEAESRSYTRQLAEYVVRRVEAKENKRYLGRKLGNIAKREKKSVVMAMIDIALADNLTTEFYEGSFIHNDVNVVSVLLSHPSMVVGVGDAGAHITQFAGAGDTSYLFEKYVREERAMSVERAVQRLTSDLATSFGIKDRGALKAGNFADLVIFDPATIARGSEEWVTDVPGGDGRYVRHPKGIDKVFVNGELFVDGGRYTNARPGRII